MLVEHVLLENFGQHTRLECNFGVGINALAGRNGSGKTTVLSAIHFAITGESLSEGSKEEDLKFGAKKGKVQLRFSHAGATYTVTRGLGVGAKTTLEGGGLDIAKAPEANQALLELLGTNKAVLTNNVFAKQGSIDQALDHTSTERMRDLGQIFGLAGVEKLYGLLGSELGQYKFTPGLDEQLLHNLELQKTTKADLGVLELELTGCRAVIQELQGPSDQIIAAATLHVVQSRQREQAQLTLQSSHHSRDAAQVAAAEAGKTLGDFLGRCDREPTQEWVESRRAHLGILQRRHHAMAEQAVRLQNLQALQEQLRTAVVPDANELARLEALQGDLQQRIRTAESLRDGHVPLDRHPLREARGKLDTLKLQLVALQVPRPPAELAIQEAEVRQLVEVIKSGICGTCRRPLEGHSDTTHSAKSQLDVLKTTWAATQAAWIATQAAHKVEQERLTGEVAQQTELVQAAEQKLQSDCQAVIGNLQGLLKTAQQTLESLNTQLRQHQDALARLKELEGAAYATTEMPVTAEEIAQATREVDEAVDNLSKRRQLTQRQDLMDTHLERLQVEYLANLKALGDWGTLAEPPSEAAVQQARQNLERVSARTIRLQEGSREAGTLQAKLAHLDMTADQTRAQLAREEKDRRWSEILVSARDALHISQYPAVVMREYAATLNARIAHYLRILEAPFQFWLDQATMQFVASFPDRTHPAARLSGAERVTASIAFRMALVDTFASQLNFVALDEPSAYMDTVSIERLQGLFLNLKQLAGQSGRQIILITHESHLLNYVDHRVDLTPET